MVDSVAITTASKKYEHRAKRCEAKRIGAKNTQHTYTHTLTYCAQSVNFQANCMKCTQKWLSNGAEKERMSTRIVEMNYDAYFNN